MQIKIDDHRRAADPNNSAMDVDGGAGARGPGQGEDDADADADVVEEVPTKLVLEQRQLLLAKSGGRDGNMGVGGDGGRDTADIRCGRGVCVCVGWGGEGMWPP